MVIEFQGPAADGWRASLILQAEGLTSDTERCRDCDCLPDDHYGEHVGGGCACGDCEGYTL